MGWPSFIHIVTDALVPVKEQVRVTALPSGIAASSGLDDDMLAVGTEGKQRERNIQ